MLHQVQIGSRLRLRHAALQAPDSGEPGVPAILGVGRVRLTHYPEIHVFGKRKPSRHHPDHGSRASIPQQRLADRIRIRMKVLPPESIADQNIARDVAVEVFVVAREIVPQRGRDAQHLQESRRHNRALNLHRQRTRCIHGIFRQVSADRLKAAVQAVPILKPQWRQQTFRTLLLGAILVQHHQPIRIRVGKRAQQHGIDCRKYRRVRTDPERERRNHSQRERWRPAQNSPSVPRTRHHRIHKRQPMHVAQLFLDLLRPAKFENGFAPRLLRRQSLREFFFRQRFDMKLDLIVQFRRLRLSPSPHLKSPTARSA